MFMMAQQQELKTTPNTITEVELDWLAEGEC